MFQSQDVISVRFVGEMRGLLMAGAESESICTGCADYRPSIYYWDVSDVAVESSTGQEFVWRLHCVFVMMTWMQRLQG
jgi:hypothetical protein